MEIGGYTETIQSPVESIDQRKRTRGRYKLQLSGALTMGIFSVEILFNSEKNDGKILGEFA